MSSLRRTSLLGAAGLCAAAPALAQQQPASMDLGGEIFAAHTTSLPGGAGLGGLALTLSSGGVGVRVGGGFNRRHDALDDVATVPWTIDGDLYIGSTALGQVLGVLAGGFSPVAFVGIGQLGISEAYGAASSVTTFSYGGGASVPLFDGLRLAAEVRQRRALSSISDMAPYGIGNGREIRVSLNFGGRASSRSAMPTRRPSRSGDVVLAGGSRPASTAASASARAVLATADEYLGVRYVYGGENPRTGIDCSAFTQLVFRRNGVTLPRTSRQQVLIGTEVLLDVGVMRPGDLLFFASNGTRIDHVAIYAGNNRIIHATASGGEVRYDDLGTQRGAWFVNHMVAARRVLDTGRSFQAQLAAALKLAPLLDASDLAPRPR